MGAPHYLIATATSSAVAFHMVAALEIYSEEMEQLVSMRLNMDRYQRVSEQVGVIQRHCLALPSFSVAGVELLIAHSEVIYAVWRAQDLPVPMECDDVAGRWNDLLACIERMRRLSLNRLVRS